jgi:serine-type D-Ala-D-Ala carboxypeptidase/endopeptidase
MALLGHILVSKAGVTYEQLVIDRIRNVLGMNSTRITLSDTLKSRLTTGHMNGHPLPIIEDPLPYAPAGGFRSTASDMAKYLAANMGLIKTNLFSAMKISHQTRFNTNITGFSGHSRVYVGLAWFTTSTPNTAGTTEKIIWDNGQFNGYNGFIGFNPNKQRGVVILCSSVQKSLRVSQIGFGPYDNLSNIIWNLLNQ